MGPIADREALRSKINSLRWFHQIDFGNGLLAPGAKKIDVLRAEAQIYFDEPLYGLTVLDIGCWGGFNSFEAFRRGANRVLATDVSFRRIQETSDRGKHLNLLGSASHRLQKFWTSIFPS